MMIKIIKKETIKVGKWSGGTSAELMISDGGDYALRQFDYRISTATVEVEHSTFTKLPGIKRWIMSLSSPLKLIHPQKSILLKPYEVYKFDGGIETESYGQVVDFNLMTQGNYSGSLLYIEVEANEIIYFNAEKQGVYLIEGLIEVSNTIFGAGDFVWLENESIHMKALEISRFVKVDIKKI